MMSLSAYRALCLISTQGGRKRNARHDLGKDGSETGPSICRSSLIPRRELLRASKGEAHVPRAFGKDHLKDYSIFNGPVGS